MASRKRKFTDGWEWVSTVDLTPPWLKRQETEAVAPQRARESAGMLAVGAAVVIGLVGLMRWQHQRAKPAPEPEVVHVETAAEPVRTVAIRVPRTPDGLEKIRESATYWMRQLHQYRDDQIAVMVWNECWHDVQYPGRPHPDDHPTVTRAHALVSSALMFARAELEAERAAKGEPVFEDAPRADAVLDELDDAVPDHALTFAPGELDFADAAVPNVVEVHQPVAGAKNDAIDRMTHERPTPGYFFRIDDQTAADGIEELASLAVLSGLLESAHEKGWSADRTMRRANQVAESMECLVDYEALIRQSEWNAGRVEPLRPGLAVWLPPIQPTGLLNRRKHPQVSLDPRPWPDGSSRIEPPPEVRPRWGAAEVLQLFGPVVT